MSRVAESSALPGEIQECAQTLTHKGRSLTRIRTLVTTVAVLLTVTASLASTEPMRLSHIRPANSVVDNDLKALAFEVGRNTTIRIQVVANNQLGDYSTVQKSVASGAIEMALQPASAEVDRRMQIGLLPYLVSDWDQARSAFGRSGVLRQAMEDLYAQQGIRVLAAYPQYFGGIALSKRPISPQDPRINKSLTIRVPPAGVFVELAQFIGYQAKPLPFADAAKALKSGTVDGLLGSGAEGYYSTFLDHTKFFIRANTHFEVWYLIMNSAKYESLRQSDRVELEKALKYFEALRWSRAEMLQIFNEKRLRDSGVNMIRLTPDELTSFSETAREYVWPKSIAEIGASYATPLLRRLKEDGERSQTAR